MTTQVPTTGIADASITTAKFAPTAVAPLADSAVTQAPGNNTTKLATTAYADAAALAAAIAKSVPSGAIAHFAMNAAPTGWLKANGAAVSRTTYAALFAAIGTTFGVGDGSTTFNVPEMRAEFIRGWDDSRGIDSGRVFGSAQSPTSISTVVTNGTNVVINNGESVGSGSQSYFSTNTGATGYTEYAVRPRNIALLVCIKA